MLKDRYSRDVMPVRPFRRFAPVTMSNSGVDPNGNYFDFIGKDVKKNIDVHRDFKLERKRCPSEESLLPAVPVGTTTCTYKMGLNDEGKFDRVKNSIRVEKFPRNPTDRTSFEAPANSRPFQGLFDRMVNTKTFEKNSEAGTPWAPKVNKIQSLSNRNSTTHNIITG